jgi:hypothetical protein
LSITLGAAVPGIVAPAGGPPVSARGAGVSAGVCAATSGPDADAAAGDDDDDDDDAGTVAGGDGAGTTATAGLAAALAGTATEPIFTLALAFAGAVVEQALTHINSAAAAAAAQVPRVRAAGIYSSADIEIPIDINTLNTIRRTCHGRLEDASIQ